jgi:hypothetical protein
MILKNQSPANAPCTSSKSGSSLLRISEDGRNYSMVYRPPSACPDRIEESRNRRVLGKKVEDFGIGIGMNIGASMCKSVSK